MIIRQIDPNDKDWQFGKGRNNYLSGTRALIQNVETRLAAALGECFFNLGAGIDWLNLLGQKDITPLNLAISAVILNTQDVAGIKQLLLNLSPSRNLTIQYRVQTTFSEAAGQFQYDLNAIG